MARNPRSSWGTAEDETFKVGGVGNPAYTTSFDANKKLANIRQTDNFVLAIEYVKGSETEMQVQFSFKLYQDVDAIMFTDSIVDVSNGNVSNFIYKFAATGNYRLSIPVSLGETAIQVATRTVGASNATTATKFSFTTNNIRNG